MIFRVPNGARVLAKFELISFWGARVGAPGYILVTMLVRSASGTSKTLQKRGLGTPKSRILVIYL